MNINTLIYRNLKKNLKNYFLYVFALVFSVGLYFSFVTLQYDPAMNEAKGSIKGGAAIRAASVLLIAIVTIFLLYANTIFIKRRSKEIGLFQLIGMTKSRIFGILTAENFLLYFGSMLVGVFIGFSFSKLVMMIMFKVTGVNEVASLHFSTKAFVQTIIVFVLIYLFIMAMNYLFIRKQTVLSLFRVTSSTEGKINKMSFWGVAIGLAGILFIALGYYVSTRLFGGDFISMTSLFAAMAFILASVILGTYLFYKGSVSFIANVIRKRKGGYLNINDVLSLSSIMFRMKSNAVLLTVITTVSALAIGLLSLSYISYYSAEKMAEQYVPNDFTLKRADDAEKFEVILKRNGIGYKEIEIETVQAQLYLKDIMTGKIEDGGADPYTMQTAVVSDSSVGWSPLSKDEVVLSGYSDFLGKMMPLKDKGEVKIKGKTLDIPLSYLGMKKKHFISVYFTSGGPIAIVSQEIFDEVKKEADPAIQKPISKYIGIDIENKEMLKKANELFQASGFMEGAGNDTRLGSTEIQKKNMGLAMFIVGFLGLTFLITSGCILYFKQMDEGEEERPNYTILRKLGYTQNDLLKGIQRKQLFNFGIPLIIGLSHSYFAVQSGWFLFGSELWTPIFIVMVLYTALYSIFGFLSVLYYKRVIKEAL